MHTKHLFQLISLFALIIIASCENLKAQDHDWDATYTSDVVLEIAANKKATYTKKGKYVILNKDGLKFCKLQFAYGFNTKIVSISARINSMNGKTIKKLKKSEIYDINAQSRGSLYIDSRLKIFSLSNNYFPFILEYEVVKEFYDPFMYPDWIPELDYHLLNVSSSFKLVETTENATNIYEQNIKTSHSGLLIHEWHVDSLPPIADEIFSYSEYWDIPKVLLAPATFELEFKGDNNSWIGFGNWISALNKDRGELTIEEKIKIDSIIKNADSDFEKIDKLYHYLQQNTRYVSIQEEIGGWQPFSAEYVCNNKYGDCKALANYMHAMLNYAGIKSYYTLVKAGYNVPDIITDFTSNQFNHAIVMIPMNTDTIWLDCTSKVCPTGFVERSNADRHVLIIEKDKSRIEKTPSYNAKQNLINIKGTIKINEDLSGSGDICLINFAYCSTDSRSLNKYYNAHLSDKYTDHKLNLPSYTINSNEHTEGVTGYIPYTIDSLNFKVKIAGKKAGSELFLCYPLETSITSSFEIEKRVNDIYLPISYTRTDSLYYIPPQGYTLSAPYHFEYKSEFGNVEYHLSTQNNQIFMLATYLVNKGRYPKENILEFKNFVKNIDKIESYEICLSKVE